MQTAAQKLSNTGLFSDIRFAFDGQTLNFILKPSQQGQPVFYTNFLWWSSDALGEAVAGKVVLFHGSLVPSSGMQAQIVAALTALVQEKGVTATVEALPHRNDAGQADGTEFQITAPAVQIGQVTFVGASAAWSEKLDALNKAAEGQPIAENTKAAIDEALKAIYHREGYLDVSLTNLNYGTPQVSDDKVLVPINVTLQEGSQYHLSELKLTGDVWMTPEDFTKRARIHAGDVANEDSLRQTLTGVARPYQAKGYLRARISADPVFDRTQHTVAYTISVVPGPVFHMGKLTVTGLDVAKQALVEQYWALHEGDTFDETYPPTFLNRNSKTLHALDGWSASYKQYTNEETHVVDLTVSFAQGGPLQ